MQPPEFGTDSICEKLLQVLSIKYFGLRRKVTLYIRGPNSENAHKKIGHHGFKRVVGIGQELHADGVKLHSFPEMLWTLPFLGGAGLRYAQCAECEHGSDQTHRPALAAGPICDCFPLRWECFDSIQLVESKEGFLVQNWQNRMNIREISLDVLIELPNIESPFCDLSRCMNYVVDIGFPRLSDGPFGHGIEFFRLGIHIN